LALANPDNLQDVDPALGLQNEVDHHAAGMNTYRTLWVVPVVTPPGVSRFGLELRCRFVIDDVAVGGVQVWKRAWCRSPTAPR
jgi:hypothetical protein